MPMLIMIVITEYTAAQLESYCYTPCHLGIHPIATLMRIVYQSDWVAMQHHSA